MNSLLFFNLKILHIVSATLLLTSMVYSVYLWRFTDVYKQATTNYAVIMKQTALVILPLAIIQLISGFTMISLQNYQMNHLWIKGSVIGFVLALGSWLCFIYNLMSAQAPHQYKYLRIIQVSSLSICIPALLTMIFFMVSKIGEN